MKTRDFLQKCRWVHACIGISIFISCVGCDNDVVPGVRNNLAIQSENNPPIAHSISKAISKNSSLTINLSSLGWDQDGDELTYSNILQLPQSGMLELVDGRFKRTSHGILEDRGFDQSIYTFTKHIKPSEKKFDGRMLNVRYTPNENYIGNDSFTYIMTDSRGAKSSVEKVLISVHEKITIEENHAPSAKDFFISMPVKTAIYVDLRSLTQDFDGDALDFTYINNATFKKTSHGMVQGARSFHYLPNSVGEETLSYTFIDSAGNNATGKITINVSEEKRGESFGLLLSSLLSKSQAMEGEGLKNIKLFFSSLPIKRFIGSGSRALLYLVAGLIGGFFLTRLFQIYILNRKILRFTYVGLALLGVYLIKDGLYRHSIPGIFIGFGFAISGSLPLFFIEFSRLRAYCLSRPSKVLATVVILLANYLIIYYHYTAISLPAFALDSTSYMPMYNFFKYDILPGIVPGEHSERLLVPFLASMVPVGNPVNAFKIVNIIFINLGVLALLKLWKELKIEPYLILIAFLWLFLHQYGIIRWHNFWPTTIDVPAYFFRTLLIYVVLKDRYKWLLFICPLGTLHHQSIFFFTIALLGYNLFVYYCSSNRGRENQDSIKWTLLSIAITFFAIKFLPLSIYPSYFGQQEHVILERFVHYYLGVAPLFMLTLVCLCFYSYGAFLIFFVQNIHLSYRNDNLYKVLILFSTISVAFCIITMSSRAIFMGYPFIMTLALLSINALPFSLTTFGVILSLPLTKIAVDFPFVPENSPLFSELSPGMISAYGIYMILLYHLLAYLQKTNFDKKMDDILKYFRKPSHSNYGI